MKWAILIVALFVFASVNDAFAYDAEDYMPLAIGNSWVYQDSSETGFDTTITRITGTTTMLGYLTYILVDSSIVDNSVDTSYMQMRSDGLYMLFTFTEEDTNYIPQLVIPDPFFIGDEWTMMSLDSTWTEGTITYIQHIEVNGEAVALESVTVPAGFFSDCVKIVMTGYFTIVAVMGSDTIYSGEGSIGEHTIWTGEGVGPVQMLNVDVAPPETTTTTSFSVLLEYDFSDIEKMSQAKPNDVLLKTKPNPFNSSCAIIAPADAKLEIFDIDGKCVDVLSLGLDARNEHSSANDTYIWAPDASTPSGVYVVRMQTKNGQTISKRVVYLR